MSVPKDDRVYLWDIIATFLGSESVDLAACGIDESQAADLRHRLAAFADDWQRPEMDVYDNV